MEEQIKAEIETLKAKLTGELFTDMDVKNQIHNLEMKLKGVKPMDSHFTCVNCSG